MRGKFGIEDRIGIMAIKKFSYLWSEVGNITKCVGSIISIQIRIILWLSIEPQTSTFCSFFSVVEVCPNND